MKGKNSSHLQPKSYLNQQNQSLQKAILTLRNTWIIRNLLSSKSTFLQSILSHPQNTNSKRVSNLTMLKVLQAAKRNTNNPSQLSKCKNLNLHEKRTVLVRLIKEGDQDLKESKIHNESSKTKVWFISIRAWWTNLLW